MTVRPRVFLAVLPLVGIGLTLYSAYAHSGAGHRLVGHVYAGGKPLPHFFLGFRRGQDAKSLLVETDSTGEYVVTLSGLGAYRVFFRPIRFLPVGSIELDVGTRDSQVDFAIPDTTLALSDLGSIGARQAWQLHLYNQAHDAAASSDFSGFARPDDRNVLLRGIPPGQYKLFADSPPNFVSAEASNVNLSIGSRTDVQVRLVASEQTMRAVDETGVPVAGFIVYANNRILRSDSTGSLRLSRAAPGLPLVLSAAGFSPTCVMAPTVGSPELIAPMRRISTLRITLVVGPETDWPFGFIRSDADQCLIPVKHYHSESTRANSGQAQVILSGVADAPYTYKLSSAEEEGVRLQPGSSASILSPIGCATCYADYPATAMKSSGR